MKLPRTKNSCAVVSYWHVPCGYMYDKAYVVELFFDDMEEAKAFAIEYDAPPEMASLTSIQQFDEIIARSAKNYREYKKRFNGCFGA